LVKKSKLYFLEVACWRNLTILFSGSNLAFEGYVKFPAIYHS